MKNMTECARSAVMLDGEISKNVDISQGVAQGCTLSPNLVNAYINDMIVAVEVAQRRMMKNMTECARRAVMLDGEISKNVDTLQGVGQGCTLSPNLFNVY